MNKQTNNRKRKRSVTEAMKQKVMALYVTQRCSLRQIKAQTGVTRLTITRWAKKENWDGMRVALDEGLKKAIVEDGIKEGLLNIETIRLLQKDCIDVAKNLRSDNRDASIRTAIKLEELNLKKALVDPSNKGNKSIAGLMTLLGDNE